jgi:hypothetical protein
MIADFNHGFHGFFTTKTRNTRRFQAALCTRNALSSKPVFAAVAISRPQGQLHRPYFISCLKLLSEAEQITQFLGRRFPKRALRFAACAIAGFVFELP